MSNRPGLQVLGKKGRAFSLLGLVYSGHKVVKGRKEMEEQVLAVQRMQDYIGEHYGEPITLEELSRAAHYSTWYSYRLFVRLLGLTPADYTRKLRLSKSALRLRDEKVRIAEVAFEFGFSSVDGYQRAFYREFGCNPGEFAANPVPISLFTPYGIQYANVRKEKVMENVKTVFVQVVDRPARKVIIKRGVKARNYFEYCEEVGCDVYGLLSSIKSICDEPVCYWLPESYILPGTSEYVHGAEVAMDYSGPVPEGFDLLEFPAAKYLRFQGEPFPEEEYAEAVDQMWDAIKKFNPQPMGYAWDKENPRIQLAPVGTRGYIEFVAIKEK